MKISFIIPSRNNLKYLEWSYDAIKKNCGAHDVQICIADDASTDGTHEWLEKIAAVDPNINYIVNDSGVRLGHTILYDRLVNEVAKHDVCIIYHADMYLCPGALDAIEKHLYFRVHHDHVAGGFEMVPQYKTIVSLTRIEPPLHPDGPEKVLTNFGVEPEEFDEEKLLNSLSQIKSSHKKPPYNTTEGIFAPWAFFKKDFQEIGGHDPLYRPQSKEDSIAAGTLVFVEIDGFKQIMRVDTLWDKYSKHSYIRSDGKHVIDLQGLSGSVKILTPKDGGVIGMESINAMIKHTTNSHRMVTVKVGWGLVNITMDHSLIDRNCTAVKFNEVESENIWEPIRFSEWCRRNTLTSLSFESTDALNDLNTGRNDYVLPSFENIDEYGTNERLKDFCEFLGFFVAEGSVSENNSISICGNDSDELTYYANLFCDIFNANSTTIQTSYKDIGDPVYSYRWGSKKLSASLRELVGSGAENKMVPNFIFNLPKAYQESFLYGYLRGDGYLGTTLKFRGYDSHTMISVDKRLIFKKYALKQYTWKSTSKSDILTNGINYLLMRCFPDVKFRINYDDARDVYNLSSCTYRKSYTSSKKSAKFVEDDLEVDVYDFEVRNGSTFIGGVGFFGLHNSDIFNRFALTGFKFIQTWDGYVYHMTCRGSRFNPTLTTPGKNSEEWEMQNVRSSRNFIRKWGHFVQHDEYMKPIIPHKYDIGFVIKNCTLDHLGYFEPWASDIYVDLDTDTIEYYIHSEQPNTDFDLSTRIHHMVDDPVVNDIIVFIDGRMLTDDDVNILHHLSEILTDSGEVADVMTVGNLTFRINSMDTYEKELIICKK